MGVVVTGLDELTPRRLQDASEVANPTVSLSVDLPPEGTPWLQVYAKLDDAVKNGDKMAAKRLYTDSYRCLRYRDSSDLIDIKANKYNGLAYTSSSTKKEYERSLTKFGDELEVSSEVCGESGSPEDYREMVNVISEAARLGVPSAQRCYVSGTFAAEAEDKHKSKMELEYSLLAPTYLSDAITRGDWTMISLLVDAARPGGSTAFPLINTVVKPSPEILYGLRRLEYYGSSPHEKIDIQSELDWMQARYGLSTTSVAAADEWASSIYAQFFNEHARGEPAAEVCAPQ